MVYFNTADNYMCYHDALSIYEGTPTTYDLKNDRANRIEKLCGGPGGTWNNYGAGKVHSPRNKRKMEIPYTSVSNVVSLYLDVIYGARFELTVTAVEATAPVDFGFRKPSTTDAGQEV